MDYLQYLKNINSPDIDVARVLNLIINGLPSILKYNAELMFGYSEVLNLIINGLPSISKM